MRCMADEGDCRVAGFPGNPKPVTENLWIGLHVDSLGDGIGGHAPESNDAGGRGFRTNLKWYFYLISALARTFGTFYFAWINPTSPKALVPFIICSSFLIYLLLGWKYERYTSIKPKTKKNNPKPKTINEPFLLIICKYHHKSAIPTPQETNASLPIELTPEPNYKILSLNEGANAQLPFLAAHSLATIATNDGIANQQDQIPKRTSTEQSQILRLPLLSIAEYLKVERAKIVVGAVTTQRLYSQSIYIIQVSSYYQKISGKQSVNFFLSNPSERGNPAPTLKARLPQKTPSASPGQARNLTITKQIYHTASTLLRSARGRSLPAQY